MVDLSTQNYIHTLFLYDFGVPLNATIFIRKYLQRQRLKHYWYLQWVKKRIERINLSTHTNDLYWWIFEEDVTTNEFEVWLCCLDDIGPRKSRSVSVGSFIVNDGLDIELCGHHTKKILSMRYVPSFLSYVYAWSTYTDEQFVAKITLTKSEFYTTIEDLFETIISTHKIPFEYYGVK